jgi:hypothetical protein
VSFRYAASTGYFSYDWRREGQSIQLAWSGSGEAANFRILLPQGARVQSVVIDGKTSEIRTEDVGPSRYLLLSAPASRGSIAVTL